MKKQLLHLLLLAGLITYNFLHSEPVLPDPTYTSQIKSWAERYPTCYNSLYMTANATLTVLAGYTYAKLFLPELLEKDWPLSLKGIFYDFSSDILQPYNGINLTITGGIMFATRQAIHNSACGKICEATDELSKLKAGLILLSGGLAGCWLNRYINS